MGSTSVGVATHDVNFMTYLGDSPGGFGWTHRGYTYNYLAMATVRRRDRCISTDHIFSDGDVVGVMVDCTGVPTLRLFLNGPEVYQVVVAGEVCGQVVFPAFYVNTAQLEIYQFDG